MCLVRGVSARQLVMRASEHAASSVLRVQTANVWPRLNVTDSLDPHNLRAAS